MASARISRQINWTRRGYVSSSSNAVDPSVKLEALEAVIAPQLRTGRFKATDALIASLDPRMFMRRTSA